MQSLIPTQEEKKELEARFNSASATKSDLAKAGLGVVAVGGSALMLSDSAQAQATPVADIQAQVTSLGTLAAAGLAVVLVPFGIYYAFRVIKRVMSGT